MAKHGDLIVKVGDLPEVKSMLGAAAAEIDRLRSALQEIVAVEPTSTTSRLDVPEWADALDRAQAIAAAALEDT